MNRPLEVKEELPSRRQAVELQRDRLESTLYVKVQSVDGKRKLWFSWRKKTSALLPILMNFVRKSCLD